MEIGLAWNAGHVGKVYSGALLAVVGVFSMAGTLRLIPQSTQCNRALFLRTQVQYKTMKTEQCRFHQLQKENGVARLKIVDSEQAKKSPPDYSQRATNHEESRYSS
jgi:hypothetical protein